MTNIAAQETSKADPKLSPAIATEPAKETAKTAEKKREILLNPSRLKPAEYVRNVFNIRPEHGTLKEDMLQPKYWTHVAASMKPFDKIEACAEDGSFYAEFLVVSTDRNWAAVHMLAYHDLTKINLGINEEVISQYAVTFKGPKGWCVIRKGDSSIINENLHSEGDGWKWLDVHLNKRGAA